MTFSTPIVVNVKDRSVWLYGDSSDFYYQKAQPHIDGLAPLGRLVARNTAPADVIVDVGANIGLSTITLALANPAAKIIAVEPSPANAAFLRQNLAANGFDTVEVVEAAVSNRPGTLTVHQNGAWTHVLDPAKPLPGVIGIPVPVVTLDLLAAGRGRVGFVKIDTEGYEPHVLAGGRAMLERDRPLMFIEFHSWCLTGVAGVSPAAFAETLWDRFTVERVEADGTLTSAPASAYRFLHANMTERGLVEDLVIRLRPGAEAPTLEQMAMHPSFAAELARLRAANQALLTSRSWRITAPLRVAVTALRRSRPAT